MVTFLPVSKPKSSTHFPSPLFTHLYSGRTHRKIFFNKLSYPWKSCSFFALQLLNMESKKTEKPFKCISKQSKARVNWKHRNWCVEGEWTNWWVEIQTVSDFSKIKSDVRKYYVLVQKVDSVKICWMWKYIMGFKCKQWAPLFNGNTLTHISPLHGGSTIRYR